MNTAGEKRKAEEAVLQLARPRKVVVVAAAAATTAKMDPRLLESSTEELNDELARLETQRLELKSALREIKFKMGEIRRLVGARNAAQHMEDFHLQTTIQGSLIPPPNLYYLMTHLI
jgi:predicted  nucleic acid-binding Zn-ribbon protein